MNTAVSDVEIVWKPTRPPATRDCFNFAANSATEFARLMEDLNNG